MYKSIIQAAGNTFPGNIKVDIGTEYVRTVADGSLHNGFPTKLLLRKQRNTMLVSEGIVEKISGRYTAFLSGIYSVDFSFPFRIYNSEKEKLYNRYNTKPEIFQSQLHIRLVPVSLSMDSLTADLFITYNKLSLDDVPRWTPIKKRIILIKGSSLMIPLPKENWSAVFSRNNENYEIFGYSDFEKSVNEYVRITFNSILQSTWSK